MNIALPDASSELYNLIKAEKRNCREDIMKTVGDMSIEELENVIEKKILEIFGDPDSGLELSDDFKEKLLKRLNSGSKRISHQEVVEKFG